MKPERVLLISLALCLAGCRYDANEAPLDDDTASLKLQARAATAAGQLGSRLKSRLIETMGAEGPVAAIGVCNIEAPEIAADVSAAAGLDVGRTSLRVRNPDNAPTDAARAVLERWAASVEAGTPPGELTVHVAAGPPFLWMKPIVIEGPCLVCHGESIAAPVADAIAARYPGDAATGYALGDLRGAFVVRQRNASAQPANADR